MKEHFIQYFFWLVGFTFPWLVLSRPLNILIIYVQKKLLEEYYLSRKIENPEKAKNPKDKLEEHFMDKISSHMGAAERALYIIAVMINEYALITGWLVMKAFYGWIVRNNNRKDILVSYNVYLISNLISLLFGLLGGWIALQILLFLKSIFIV